MNTGVTGDADVKHPLQDPPLLDIVFGYCSFTNLKSCRQVCKLWQSSSLKAWKSAVRVKIFPEGGVREASNFLQLIGQNTEIFADYFMLCQDIPQFWARCGIFIKHLYLGNIQFETLSEFRHVVYKSCPNMEELILSDIKILNRVPIEWEETELKAQKSLKVLTIHQFGFRQDFPISWIEFISHFPFLEEICLNLRVPSNIDGMFAAIKAIRQEHPDKLQIKVIEDFSFKSDDTPIRPEFLSVLLDPAINLQRLIFKVDDTCTKNINEICSNHFASLKELSIRNEGYEHFKLNPMKCFPQNLIFENLQELSVDSIFTSLEFLKLTPNLKILSLSGEKLSSMVLKTYSIKMANFKLENCKILRVHDPMRFGALKMLISWVPNVERLKVTELDNDTFELVCGHYPNLIELKMDAICVDDCGFTGMNKNDVKKINKNGESSSWRPNNVTRANLSDLKNLRTLKINGFQRIQEGVPSAYQVSRENAKLGYSTAVYGIQHLPRLQNLSIMFCQLTGDIWKNILSRFHEHQMKNCCGIKFN